MRAGVVRVMAGTVVALAMLVAVSAASARTWSVTTPPLPASNAFGQFTGVSCTSASFCMVVGWAASTPSYVHDGIAEAWDGSAWALIPMPAVYQSVACTSAGSCVAVSPSDGSAIWDGSSWHAVPMPLPVPSGGGSSTISSVACASPSSCTAAGTTSTDADLNAGTPAFVSALVERWNGSSWTVDRNLAPAGRGAPVMVDGVPVTGSSLGGAACAPGGSCLVVGRLVTSDFVSGSPDPHVQGTYFTAFPMAETFLAGEWMPQPAAGTSPLTEDNYLDAVSCTTASACTAVGDTFDSSNANTTYYGTALIDRYDGTSWTQQSVPSANDLQLNAVSCPSAADCTAVGFQLGDDPLVLDWTGSAWTDDTPAGLTYGSLADVSCVSSTMCVAVGLDQTIDSSS